MCNMEFDPKGIYLRALKLFIEVDDEEWEWQELEQKYARNLNREEIADAFGEEAEEGREMKLC